MCDARKTAYLFSEVFSRNSIQPNSLRMTTRSSDCHSTAIAMTTHLNALLVLKQSIIDFVLKRRNEKKKSRGCKPASVFR